MSPSLDVLPSSIIRAAKFSRTFIRKLSSRLVFIVKGTVMRSSFFGESPCCIRVSENTRLLGSSVNRGYPPPMRNTGHRDSSKTSVPNKKEQSIVGRGELSDMQRGRLQRCSCRRTADAAVGGSPQGTPGAVRQSSSYGAHQLIGVFRHALAVEIKPVSPKARAYMSGAAWPEIVEALTVAFAVSPSHCCRVAAQGLL